MESAKRTKIGEVVEKAEMMDAMKVEAFIEKLCIEGREWINLAGDSWHDSFFIISVEYSMRIGFPETAVLCSGPSMDGTGKPLTKTKLHIIE
jgi:hypothetical protein